MKVKDLIEILQQADPDMSVVVWDPAAPAKKRKEFLADYGFEPKVVAIRDLFAGGNVVLLRPREHSEKSGELSLEHREVPLPSWCSG